MKLTRPPRKVGMDVTDDANKDPWADQLMDLMIDNKLQFPTVAKTVKNEQTVQFSVRTYARFRDIAETMYSKFPEVYGSIAGFMRAAMYTGIQLHASQIRHSLPESERWRIDVVIGYMQETATQTEDYHIMDILLKRAAQIKQNFDNAIMDSEEMRSQVDALFDPLPSHLDKAFENKMNQLLAGELVTNLYECRRKIGGRDREVG